MRIGRSPVTVFPMQIAQKRIHNHVVNDGSLIEGVVDLAFREDRSDFSGWTVVDFKTDREFAASARYLAQVRLYSQAIRAATDSPVRGVLLVL